jgi:hypothetical protein
MPAEYAYAPGAFLFPRAHPTNPSHVFTLVVTNGPRNFHVERCFTLLAVVTSNVEEGKDVSRMRTTSLYNNEAWFFGNIPRAMIDR